MLMGMDVSRYQVLFDSAGNLIAPIDFAKAKSQGVRFVAARASVGDYYTDPAFQSNFDRAEEQGLYVTAYHVVRPDKPIVAQVDRFFTALGGRKPNLPLVLDCEVKAGLLPDRITTVNRGCVLDIAEREGRRPLIYTRQSWYDINTEPDEEISKCDLWPARYKSGLISPWSDDYYKFRDWNAWKIWQYSADGNGLGYQFGVQSASIDLDWFNGTEEEFMAYAGIVTEKRVRVIADVARIWDAAGSNGITSGITWEDQIWNSTGEIDINGEIYVHIDGYIKKALVQEV